MDSQHIDKVLELKGQYRDKMNRWEREFVGDMHIMHRRNPAKSLSDGQAAIIENIWNKVSK